MNYCGRCGHQIQQSTAKFCPQCGMQLRQVETPADPPAPGAAPAPGAPITRETSGLAIGSLICGILFFIFPSAIAAIVMGHISRAEIRRSEGRKTGAGMALAGLVLGYVGVSIIPILIIAAIAIPNLLRSKMMANEASAVGSMRTLNAASVAYFTTYGYGRYPSSLMGLGPAAMEGGPTAESADLIDSVLASGSRSGYVFHYEPFNAEWGGVKIFGYSISARPIYPGTTGQRYYFTDQTAVIRVEMNRVATANSPPLK